MLKCYSNDLYTKKSVFIQKQFLCADCEHEGDNKNVIVFS